MQLALDNRGGDGMKYKYVYDIRTSANALRTLINFTGVDSPIWEKFILRRKEYQYEDDLVKDSILPQVLISVVHLKSMAS